MDTEGACGLSGETKKLYELLKASNEEQTKILAQEITKLKTLTDQRVEALSVRCTNSERARRKNNVVVFGLEIGDQLVNNTISEINRLLELNIQEQDINNIYYVGKQERKRGIVIEFVSYLKKLSIFKNVKKLKGTKVAIVNDLIPEDRLINKILVKHLKIAKQENKQARIRGNLLEIEGKKYTADQLENKGEEDEYTELETESDEDSPRSLPGKDRPTSSADCGAKRKRKEKISPKKLRRPRKQKK